MVVCLPEYDSPIFAGCRKPSVVRRVRKGADILVIMMGILEVLYSKIGH